MEQTLLSRQELAKRWGFESSHAIIDMEKEGVITRIPTIPSPRYRLSEILKIETYGEGVNPLSPIERKRLEKELDQVRKERDFYKNKIDSAKMALS